MNTLNELLPDIKLRFDIAHPSFEECYAFGYECALADVSEGDNPFQIGSKESEQWLEGWWAGFYNEKPLYDISGYLQPSEATFDAAANDEQYAEHKTGFITKVLEISGVIAVSALLGYQVIDLVA